MRKVAEFLTSEIFPHHVRLCGPSLVDKNVKQVNEIQIDFARDSLLLGCHEKLVNTRKNGFVCFILRTDLQAPNYFFLLLASYWDLLYLTNSLILTGWWRKSGVKRSKCEWVFRNTQINKASKGGREWRRKFEYFNEKNVSHKQNFFIAFD